MNIGHNGAPEDDDARATNWFAVSRDIFEHPIVGIGDRSYTDTEAWLWLLASASYETKRAMNKGTIIVLDPGDLMAAHGYLATKWKWTIGQVRAFLKRLELDAMITRFCNKQSDNRRNNQIQIITICNYTRYQLIKEAQEQAAQQAKQQPSNKPTTSEQQANDTNLTLKHLNTSTLEEENSASAPSEHSADADPPPPQKRDLAPDVDAHQAFAAWNDLALRCGLPQARSLTPGRRQKLIARIREHGGMEAWARALANVERSSFLRGSNDRGWRADFDFLLQPTSFAKVVDGIYGNGAHAQPSWPKNNIREMAKRAARGEPMRETNESDTLLEVDWRQIQ